MKKPHSLNEAHLAELTRKAAEATGFSLDAVHAEPLRRAAEELLAMGLEPEELLRRVEKGDRRALDMFYQAVSVGETFFFRQPEHFVYLAQEFLPQWRARGGHMLRVWSAGCASGEEAYSLAACLQAHLHGSPIVLSVLGTDALGDRIEQAERGTYGKFSVRESAPLMYPVLEKARNGEHQVPRKIRSATRFVTHDFRNGAPDDGGQFDVIFCRNVLVYFSPEGAKEASAQLALALAPEGLLAFGPTDIGAAPPGLVAVGTAGLNCFTKPLKKAATKKGAAPAPAPRTEARAHSAEAERKPVVSPPRKIAADKSKDWSHAIALHLVALRYIERGDEKKALEGLTQMSQLYGDYLPGILENALFQARRGQRQKAIELMTKIFERASSMASDLDIPGPEILPAAYYVASAEAYLGEFAPRKKRS